MNTDFTHTFHILKNWKTAAGPRDHSPKVPTQIAYDSDGTVTKWGYEISPGEKPLRWFKLLLLKDSDIPVAMRNSTYIMEAKRILRLLNKTPVQVVSDYLRVLWGHLRGEMDREDGMGVEGQRFRVVLTYPAIFPE